ncbi:MAG: hypothetical protein NC037_05755 [Bacteroides sp.]|nr:hypothetical protein [Bacillota bacterium]MCM1394294.1 hypothetical protein [[Eubacterium] siraeum]MCM1456010.1 hypothetical protein [Bacteroides sp.]
MSDILRLIAGGLLALICCYIGLLIKRRYRDRVIFYKSACEYVREMSSELTLNKTPIPDIAKKFAAGRSGEFENVLTECTAITRDGKGFEYALENVKIAKLKANEKKEIIAFLCGSGKNALSDQMAFVTYHKDVFEQKLKKCEDDSKKLGGMYFKLCVLLGIAILLILA